MKRDVIGHISVQFYDLKIEISGKQDNTYFMSQDLKLRALLALMDFDFKFMIEYDYKSMDKYFITILNKLGQMIKEETGIDHKVDNLAFLKSYLDWVTDQNVYNDPDLFEFMKDYQDPEEED